MIKILTVHHTTPEVPGHTTILFRNVLRILREKIDVHMTWVIHSPERIDTTSFEDQNTSFVYMTDYKDAVEILKKVKPDLVYVIPGFNAPDCAFLLAAKYLKIKVVGGEIGIFFFIKKSKNMISKILDVVQTNPFSVKRRSFTKMKFFIHKHIFLLRTYTAIHWNIIMIFKDYLQIIRLHLHTIDFVKIHDCDLYFIDSQKAVDELVNLGYDASKMKVTGNPSCDLFFKNMKKLENVRKDTGEIRVLLLTITVTGESKKTMLKQRNAFVIGVINQKNKSKHNMSLTIKIHPTNENYDEYKKLVDSVDPTLTVNQKGDLLGYFENSDVVITPTASTASILALIYGKPVVIWNVFETEYDVLLDNKLVIECKNEHELIPSIEKALIFHPSQKKIEDFLEEQFYKKDGKAAERIAGLMLEMIEIKD